MKKVLTSLALAVVTAIPLAIAPAPASASVLIEPPQSSRVCTCNSVRYGFFYQSHSGGTRRLRVKIYRGRTLISNKGYTAKDRWTIKYFNTQRAGRYTFTFIHRGQPSSYNLTFYNEAH